MDRAEYAQRVAEIGGEHLLTRTGLIAQLGRSSSETEPRRLTIPRNPCEPAYPPSLRLHGEVQDDELHASTGLLYTHSC